MAGYTHGIMTIRIPQEIALAIHQNARKLEVDPMKLIMEQIKLLADYDFAEMWAEDIREPREQARPQTDEA